MFEGRRRMVLMAAGKALMWNLLLKENAHAVSFVKNFPRNCAKLLQSNLKIIKAQS